MTLIEGPIDASSHSSASSAKRFFSKEEHLDWHLKNHMDERSPLRLHKKTNTDEQPFRCHYCRMGFSQRELRDQHLRGHLDDKDWLNKKHECTYCGDHFAQQSQLTCHQMLHSSNTSTNVCPNCGQAFTERHILIEHMLAQHTHGKPNACLLCGRAFALLRCLRRHEEVVHNQSLVS